MLQMYVEARFLSVFHVTACVAQLSDRRSVALFSSPISYVCSASSQTEVIGYILFYLLKSKISPSELIRSPLDSICIVTGQSKISPSEDQTVINLGRKCFPIIVLGRLFMGPKLANFGTKCFLVFHLF